jgi:hypothetical protein
MARHEQTILQQKMEGLLAIDRLENTEKRTGRSGGLTDAERDQLKHDGIQGSQQKQRSKNIDDAVKKAGG